MVEFDAFAGDVIVGGLRNMLEIKILVCYMLSRVTEPMTRKQLCDCLQETGLVKSEILSVGSDGEVAHSQKEISFKLSN